MSWACLGKGGDPAAGSPTATLLRLHPNYQPYRRRLPPGTQLVYGFYGPINQEFVDKLSAGLAGRLRVEPAFVV